MKVLCGFVCMFMIANSAYSQMVDNTRKVDTLSVKERLTLRTNLMDWALLTPNAAFEFDLRGVNWNRWTIGLGVRGNWQTHHTYKPGIVYNLNEVRLDIRNYWRPRQRTTFYRGAFASYDDYSIKLGTKGYQGDAYMAGLSCGFLHPLFVFPSGRSVDFDFGISLAAAYTKNVTYIHDREDNCYPVTGSSSWHWVKHPVIADISIGLVYRLGRVQTGQKYKYRYDCDLIYRARKDSIALDKFTRAYEKRVNDSIYRVVLHDFMHRYDSIVKAQKNAVALPKKKGGGM